MRASLRLTEDYVVSVAWREKPKVAFLFSSSLRFCFPDVVDVNAIFFSLLSFFLSSSSSSLRRIFFLKLISARAYLRREYFFQKKTLKLSINCYFLENKQKQKRKPSRKPFNQNGDDDNAALERAVRLVDLEVESWKGILQQQQPGSEPRADLNLKQATGTSQEAETSCEEKSKG